MSDVIQTPTPTATPTPAPDDRQVLLEERKAERASYQEQIQERDAQLASLIRERDTFKESVAKLEPKAKLADELQIKVEGFVNEGRYSAIVDKVRTVLPGAEPLTIRGVLSSLHESAKINRYAEDASAEAAKAIELIKSEAPSLTRMPMGASGSAVVRENPTPHKMRHPLG